ncbi:helix-turn-helix domain-containing protein [Streptomyces millisiae]|uniref:Helix-turn-helix transcriptional regulator n=1 Tax=Streptomyces millisiae TaxID=3075542 RepID=A0ABU2LRE9_9ACTN|nr:helix-turn-helix transcriptional regulator [Streptomyces sp. DSM 44918]MDT0320167.1 helix-turn-helix transcriptional regulator [Streptomyces sp. DSM 44918]
MAEAEAQSQEAQSQSQDPEAELPEDNDGARDFIRAVGKLFKRARERAGLSQQEAADRLNYGVDMVGSVESGRRVASPEMLLAADKLFGTGGLLTAVIDDLEKARTKARTRHPAWFRVFARLEGKAVEIHEYSTMVIPGLLQTESYARALYGVRQPPFSKETIDTRVADRLERQKILHNWPPPKASFVIEESVLRRQIGGREVHRGQLLNLLRAAELPGTELQIMRTDQPEHPGLTGPFTLLTPKGKSQLVYIESHGQNRLITDAEQVRLMAARYGSIRAQALNFRESTELIEKLLGEL